MNGELEDLIVMALLAPMIFAMFALLGAVGMVALVCLRRTVIPGPRPGSSPPSGRPPTG